MAARIFLDKQGALRHWVRLSIALPTVLLTAWLVPLAMTRLFQWLFPVWGVTAETVKRAPGWAQVLYGGWAYLNGALQGAAMALAAWLLGPALRARMRMGKGLGKGLLAGTAAAFTLILVFRLLDVMRFGGALSRPAFSWLTPLVTLYMVSQALGAAMAVLLLGELLSGWHRLAAIAGCGLLYALLFGRWTPVGFATGALFGASMFLMREKNGGVAPAFGFLAAFSIFTVAVFGMPPWQQGALYETYPVSKPWLTGGADGPWSGIMMLAMLAALTWVLALQNRKMKAAPPPLPARPGRVGEN
jgi:hypothetical protein